MVRLSQRLTESVLRSPTRTTFLHHGEMSASPIDSEISSELSTLSAHGPTAQRTRRPCTWRCLRHLAAAIRCFLEEMTFHPCVEVLISIFDGVLLLESFGACDVLHLPQLTALSSENLPRVSQCCQNTSRLANNTVWRRASHIITA